MRYRLLASRLKCFSICNFRRYTYNNINNKKEVTIKFKCANDTIKEVKAKVGMSILDVSRKYDLGLEGACEASVACSTCHVYVDLLSYKKLPEATENEDDMLDMAPQLTELSRLVIVTEELDGMVISFPTITRNFYVDGHKPTHH